MARLNLVLSVACLAVALSTVASGDIYNSGPLPPEFGGGFIPPDRDVFRNEQVIKTGSGIGGARLGKAQFAFFQQVEKCYSKGAINVSKGRASNVNFCLNDPSKGVLPRYAAFVNRVEGRGPGLPACHDYAFDGVLLGSLGRSLNALVYCQSPSGAFVDGPSVD